MELYRESSGQENPFNTCQIKIEQCVDSIRLLLDFNVCQEELDDSFFCKV